MRRAGPPLLGLSLLVLGGAAGLTLEPRRLGDASTYLLITDSLWADGDLVCAADDARRAEGLGLADHPRGVFLIRQASGVDTYAKPIFYSVAALPFYAAFGLQGFMVLNGVLLAALLWLGADILLHRLRWPRALAMAAVVIAASVTPVYVLWIAPRSLPWRRAERPPPCRRSARRRPQHAAASSGRTETRQRDQHQHRSG